MEKDLQRFRGGTEKGIQVKLKERNITKGGDNIKEKSTEWSNFSCVLKGEATYLEQIKDYIKKYVNKGLVTVVKSSYDKKEMYIVTEEQWKHYQKLKNKDEGLIGYDIRNG